MAAKNVTGTDTQPKPEYFNKRHPWKLSQWFRKHNEVKEEADVTPEDDTNEHLTTVEFDDSGDFIAAGIIY